MCVCVCSSPLFEITREKKEKRACKKNKGDKMSNPSRQQELLGRLELDKDEERKKERKKYLLSFKLSE